MGERAPIRGQVARVLNSREIAINRGAQHGVREGMKFAVLDPSAEDVEDPETGEILGSVYRPTVEVKVVIVKDKLSIARTFKAHQMNVGGKGVGGLGVAQLFEPPKWETRYETLKTEEKTWEDISESQSYVKTGDPVEQVLDVEVDPADQAPAHAADVGEGFAEESADTPADSAPS
jgi:hypothetical protein